MAPTMQTWINTLVMFLVLCVPNTNSQLFNSVSFGNNPQGTSSPNNAACNYLLSTNTAGGCVVTTADVEKKLNTITDDISRSRLQYVAQNSVLQAQIAKIEDSDTKTALRLDGIQRDLLALRTRLTTSVNSGSSSAGVNISQLQTSLLQNIQAVENRVSSLTSAYQRDSVSQAQTDAALQRQLTKLMQDNLQLTNSNSRLTQDYNTLRQDIQILSGQLRQLANQCRGCGGATSAPVTAPVVPTIAPGRLAQIEQNLRTLNASVQQQNQDITRLDNVVSVTHTNDLINLHAELNATTILLDSTINKTNLVYQSVQNMNRAVVTAQRDIRTLKQDVQGLDTSIQGLQTTQIILLNDTVFLKLDLSRLENDLNTGQTIQNQAIQQLNNGVAGALSGTYPQLLTTQTNVNNLLSGRPVVIPPPILTTTTAPQGPPVPPTLRPRPGK